MPLIIQDRTFYADGSLWYPAEGTNPDINPYWVEAFLGNTIMVNGKVWPNMDVAKGQYRLRILDASNTRIYGLSFLNTRTNTRVPFVQIGSDGGYLKTPVTLTELLLAPAERVDILVDFSGFDSGTKIILQNTALTGDFPSEEKTLGKIVQFTVTAENGYEAKTLPTLLNPTLAGDTFPNLPTPSKRRILTLFHVNGPQGPLMILLNGQRWGANISELPMLNATEEWVIVNLTNNAHPIHLHLIQFQTASRQNINITSYTTDWLTMQRELLGDYAAVPPWPTDFTPGELPVEPYLTGTPIPIPLNEVGWKDTVLVLPSTVTVIRARWASQDGSPFPFDATEGPAYVWHCHILEHEDNEMMRPYKVLPLSSEMPSQPISIVLILISLVVGIILLLFFLKKKWWKKAEK
jgi:FtsP/CotA-like multicopper oxidase with cupredoxin domain